MSEDVYVRKDVHDETMKRIEALMAASEARHERIAEEMRGEIKEINAKVDGLYNTFQTFKDSLNWFAILLASLQLGVALVMYMLR